MSIRLYAILLPLLAAFAFAAPSQAADVASEAAVRAVVQDQVDALAAGDADRAFSHASPKIQSMFKTPDAFMSMVRDGYGALIGPRSFTIDEVLTDGDKAAVRAQIIDREGRPFQAMYPLERQEDGHWRIDGCFLEAANGQSL